MRIDMDTCEEILVTITRNKTRSLLTAFGVFWGIFMLVALIGGGQGMQEQMKAQFEGFATNSGFIAAQKTSEAYKGFRKGRWWDLEMEDVERVRSIDGIKTATPSFALWGQTAVYGENKYECSVKGLYPEYEQIEHQEMIQYKRLPGLQRGAQAAQVDNHLGLDSLQDAAGTFGGHRVLDGNIGPAAFERAQGAAQKVQLLVATDDDRRCVY